MSKDHISLDVEPLAGLSMKRTSSVGLLGDSMFLQHGVRICHSKVPRSRSYTSLYKKGAAAAAAAAEALAECRICQEEDNIAKMESPCNCSGSLKYVHRKCLQRWCEEKGDITCEICRQPYRNGYAASSSGGNSESISLDISGYWGISGLPPIQLRDHRILAIAATQRHFLEAEHDDYTLANSRAATSCRSAALILMVLLLLQHTLSIAITEGDKDSCTLIILFILRAMCFLLPCYIIVQSLNLLQRRQHQQETGIAVAELAILFQAGQSSSDHFPSGFNR